MTVVCFLAPACASSEAESGEVTSSAPSPATTSTAAASTRAETEASELALYGTYLREPQRQWGIHFQEDVEEWDGVLEIYYQQAKRPYTNWGRAYEYSADREALHLGDVTRPRDVDLRLGGFKCPSGGPAEYRWRRSNRNYRLRLEAIVEPCEARRKILEGEWWFLD
jgi:hypothetical protein